jgi:hypothetical protein
MLRRAANGRKREAVVAAEDEGEVTRLCAGGDRARDATTHRHNAINVF